MLRIRRGPRWKSAYRSLRSLMPYERSSVIDPRSSATTTKPILSRGARNAAKLRFGPEYGEFVYRTVTDPRPNRAQALSRSAARISVSRVGLASKYDAMTRICGHPGAAFHSIAARSSTQCRLVQLSSLTRSAAQASRSPRSRITEERSTPI
jgi:hypothetical protein